MPNCHCTDFTELTIDNLHGPKVNVHRWFHAFLCLQPTLRLRFSFPVVFNNARLCSHPARAKVISPIIVTQPIFQAKSLSLGLKIKYQNSNRIGAMLLLHSFSFDMNQIKVWVDLVETNMAQK